MARPKSLRKVVKPPGFKGFRPYGCQQWNQSPVQLYYEEYEALKLVDFDVMNHLEASKVMGVSRATFARIYERARRKMALALVEVKEIKAVYGHAVFDKSWFVCNQCHASFTIPATINERKCPVCRSYDVEAIKP